MIMHMNNLALEPDKDDCDTTTLHPRQVMAARVRLTEAPAPEEIARLFSILADATRAKLLTALTSGELCVCDLAAACAVNRTTVSHQLRVLRENHIVRRRREGKVIYYSLDDDHIGSLLTMGTAHVSEQREALDRSTA
jgi:DNA-binding transcriptional ArsR family regulator